MPVGRRRAIERTVWPRKPTISPGQCRPRESIISQASPTVRMGLRIRRVVLPPAPLAPASAVRKKFPDGRSTRTEAAKSFSGSLRAVAAFAVPLGELKRRQWRPRRPFGEQVEQSGFNFLELRFQADFGRAQRSFDAAFPGSDGGIFVNLGRGNVFHLAGEVVPPVGRFFGDGRAG